MEQSYKEKYEQALSKAKDNYNAADSANINVNSFKNTLIALFPELKESGDERIESEDEKIRHYLMNFVKINDGVNLPPDYAKKALAWIEKQSEKKASYTTIVETGDGGINALVTRELSTDGEQNPTDKVEPKFKVGDWLIFNEHHNRVYQVERIDNYRYYLRHYLGGTMSVHFDNELIRLWTLQDAKSGDVLSNGQMIVIFKHFEEPLYRQHIIAYIGLDRGRDIQITDDTWRLGIDKAKPATKEQRELLFQKMHEAGYTFDFEKKKLEKIKPKPEENKGNVGGISTNWSEKDDRIIDNIETYINIASNDDHTREECIKETKDWLKSLKDRVGCEANCTTTKEWSEEDEENFRSVYLDIKSARQITVNSLSGELKEQEQKRMDEVLSWLKSLKPQNKWKPSKEQIEALNAISQTGAISYPNQGSLLVSLYRDLKRLRYEETV